jgi:hypothetical protein
MANGSAAFEPRRGGSSGLLVMEEDDQAIAQLLEQMKYLFTSLVASPKDWRQRYHGPPFAVESIDDFKLFSLVFLSFVCCLFMVL